MARFIADMNSLSLHWESGTYGAGQGARLWPGLVQTFTADESTGVIPIRYLGTATRNVDLFVDGPKDVTFSLSMFPQDWRTAVTALGSNVDSGSPSPYIHTISEINSASGGNFTSGTLNPFTSYQLVDAKRGPVTGQNFIRTLIGCNTNTWTLNGTQGEILTVDIDGIAQDVVFTSGAITEPTEDTTRPYMWRDARLHIPSGTVIDELKNFTFSINNNLEVPHYLNGSQVISPPIPLNRDYEFSATLDAESTNIKTFWESYFVGGSTLNVGGGSIFNMMLAVSASAGSREAFFIFSGCKLMDMEVPSPQEGVNEVTLTIRPENCRVIVNDLTFRYSPW